MRQTAARVARILDPQRLVDTRMSRAAVSTIAAVGALTLFALPHAPTLIAFQAQGAAVQVAQSSAGPASDSATEWKSAMPVRYSREATSPRVVQTAIRFSAPSEVEHHGIAATGKTSHAKRTIRTLGDRKSSPRLTRTSFRQENAVPSPALLLVVQTEEDLMNGSPSLTICVWRVTFVPGTAVPKTVQVQKGTISKAI
jgi:hypothetical protein